MVKREKHNIPGTIVPADHTKPKENHFEKAIYTIIVAFAIISFWRGVWGLMDVYLFPNNSILSHLISLLIGVLILLLTKNLIKHLV